MCVQKVFVIKEKIQASLKSCYFHNYSLIFTRYAELGAHIPLYIFTAVVMKNCIYWEQWHFFAFWQIHGNLFLTCKYLQSKNWYLCTDLPCEVLWHFEVLWSFYLVCHTPDCLNILGHLDRLRKLASRAVCGVKFIILGLDVVVKTKDWKLITGICKLYNKI